MTLTRGELMRLNKQLAALGRRICPCCGAQHELTPDYWYFRRSGKLATYRCRACDLALYAFQPSTDAYREWKRRYKAQYGKTDKQRQYMREYRRRKRQEQKRRRLAAVLNGITGELRTTSQETGRE